MVVCMSVRGCLYVCAYVCSVRLYVSGGGASGTGGPTRKITILIALGTTWKHAEWPYSPRHVIHRINLIQTGS